MLPSKDIGCHRTFGSLRVRSCYEMVSKHNCQLWCHVAGPNKNTGEPVEKYACLDALSHTLHLETASTVREVAGEVSMHRKENIDQSIRAAQNMAALNSNLIQMHSNALSVATAIATKRPELKLVESSPADDQPELPLIEHAHG